MEEPAAIWQQGGQLEEGPQGKSRELQSWGFWEWDQAGCRASTPPGEVTAAFIDLSASARYSWVREQQGNVGFSAKKKSVQICLVCSPAPVVSAPSLI